MNKSELRERTLDVRRSLSTETVSVGSRAIVSRLKALPEFAQANCVLTYVSSKDNEVDTHGLIEDLLREGRTVLVPIAGRNRSMEWSRLLSLDELAAGRFGILEPPPEARRIEAAPDGSVVVVPGVAFTRDGWRIGYGGGYFDTFLARFTGTSIAIAFEAQLLNSIPADEHDVPIDIVVTERAVYRRHGGETAIS